jgi:hypothetical protein
VVFKDSDTWVLVLFRIKRRLRFAVFIPIKSDRAAVIWDPCAHADIGVLPSLQLIPNRDTPELDTVSMVYSNNELDPLHVVIPNRKLYAAISAIYILIFVVGKYTSVVKGRKAIRPISGQGPINTRVI